jgi:hypothetical protein
MGLNDRSADREPHAQAMSIPCAKSSKNSKANRIETGEKSGGIRRNLFGGSRRKIAKKIADQVDRLTRSVASGHSAGAHAAFILYQSLR